MTVRVFAPAKINLTLKVGRPSAEGRHPLQSVVAFADVGDWVEASASHALTLEVSGPFATELAHAEDNLVLRAARALAARFDVKAGAHLKLEKNLPIASGIGGGSSDAAAALKALKALWKLDARREDLSAIAAPLGADVPVCVTARSAYMTGTGETTAPMHVPLLNVVLVNPLRPLATGDVYRAFDAVHLGADLGEALAPCWRNADDALAEMRRTDNDLAAPAVSILPVIADIIAVLHADSVAQHAALSGSGATCFAITDTAHDAADLAIRLKSHWPDFWIMPARIGDA